MSPAFELSPERAFVRRRESVAVVALPGFVRGRHRIPGDHGRAAEQFVHELAAAAIADEVRTIYEAAKRGLGLRRRQLSRAIAEGGGNVDAPQFRFALDVGLDPGDPGRALFQRRIEVLGDPRELPEGFDELFPIACDELVVPFVAAGRGPTLFDELVDRLEDFAEDHGGRVEEDEDRRHAALTTPDGSRVALDLDACELSLSILGIAGARALILAAQRRFVALTGLLLPAAD